MKHWCGLNGYPGSERRVHCPRRSGTKANSWLKSFWAHRFHSVKREQQLFLGPTAVICKRFPTERLYKDKLVHKKPLRELPVAGD